MVESPAQDRVADSVCHKSVDANVSESGGVTSETVCRHKSKGFAITL